MAHQQDLQEPGPGEEVTAPALVATLDLTALDLGRTISSSRLPAVRAGRVNCLLYWFVQHLGWGLEVDTRAGRAHRLAAWLVAPRQVQEGEQLAVTVHLERGLLGLSLA